MPMWILIAIVAFGLLFVLIIYNGLVSYRNAIDNAYGTIDILLKKRWDLIPNLVAVVKGYMTHEASLLERLTSLRSSAMSAEQAGNGHLQAEQQLSGALDRFRAVAESYPDLKANENFLHLQASLNECEEQLSAARRAFNAAVLQYNNTVEMFPHSLIARQFAFRRRDFFAILGSERALPSVKDSLSESVTGGADR